MIPIRQLLLILALASLLAACKHPLEIEGQGDIIERNNGIRGCALEEYVAGISRCTNNQILQDETAIYQALPRAGWSFSHWDGSCAKDSPEATCKLEYSGVFADLWDDNFPDQSAPPLKAVFVEDSSAPTATAYIASSFGITSGGAGTYSSLLDALFSADNSYRFTSLQASTRSGFDRTPAYYQVRSGGLLTAGPTPSQLVVSGAATANGDLLTLVDTDTSDGEISVTYLMPARDKASNAEFVGSYYCGHIATDGLARFVKIVANATGGGLLSVLEDREGASGSARVAYKVYEDGTMTLDYARVHLVGSLSAGGAVFVSSQLQNSGRGAAVCVRASSAKTLGNVAGQWLGSWISTGLSSAVTELLVTDSGQTAEAVYRDSIGGRSYPLGADWMLVNWDGRLSTSVQFGAVSADDRVAFTVNTNPSKFPTLILYIHKGR
jgi:hypothetical protein